MKRKYFASKGLSEEDKTRVERELTLGFLNLSDECFEQAKSTSNMFLKLTKLVRTLGGDWR